MLTLRFVWLVETVPLTLAELCRVATNHARWYLKLRRLALALTAVLPIRNEIGSEVSRSSPTFSGIILRVVLLCIESESKATYSMSFLIRLTLYKILWCLDMVSRGILLDNDI